MPCYKTFYLDDPFKMVYFFTTDELQEFDGEESFTPMSSICSIRQTRAEHGAMGYTEIANPDPAMMPEEVTRDA